MTGPNLPADLSSVQFPNRKNFPGCIRKESFVRVEKIVSCKVRFSDLKSEFERAFYHKAPVTPFKIRRSIRQLYSVLFLPENLRQNRPFAFSDLADLRGSISFSGETRYRNTSGREEYRDGCRGRNKPGIRVQCSETLPME